MRRLFLIVQLLFLFACKSDSQGLITIRLGYPVSPVNNAVFYTSPDELKGYNAFGYAFSLSDGSIVNGFKKSDNHAGQGDFGVALSTDGGNTSEIHYVRDANGTIVETSQGTFYRDTASGYLYALTIDANYSGNSPYFLKIQTYRILEETFISNPDANWEVTNVVDFTGYETDMVIGDLWGDVLKMPSGKILVPIHLRNTSTARHIALFIESTDNGETWGIGNVILDKVGGGSFPNGSFSEVNPVISTMGNADNNTTIVVLLRNETYGLFTHVKSTDGGATWVELTARTFGSDFDATVLYGSPCCIPISSRYHKGYIYSVIGYRGNSAGQNYGQITVLRLSVSDFETYGATRPSAVVTTLRSTTQIYNNVINGDQIHFGYPMLFVSFYGELWCQWYDEHSTSADWLNGDIKCRLMQTKVAD